MFDRIGRDRRLLHHIPHPSILFRSGYNFSSPRLAYVTRSPRAVLKRQYTLEIELILLDTHWRLCEYRKLGAAVATRGSEVSLASAIGH